MDDLISRKAAVEYLMTNMGWHDEDGYEIDDADEKRTCIEDLINGVPSVPAVPLDKLCEWLAENAEFPMEVEVKIFYEPTEEPEIKLNRIPNAAERWREKLTKWMEGLDAKTD